jgi:hypothetical protein
MPLRRVRRTALVALTLILLCAATSLTYARWGDVSCSPLATERCVRVLFLGNSYTFTNDLPAVFRRLGRSGGRNIEVSVVALPGETLAQHAASSDSLGAIRAGGAQIVMLQEQSQIPADAAARTSEMFPAARELVAAIDGAGARPILLETWAHRDGWPDRGLDFKGMQDQIDRAYRQLEVELPAEVAPAGEAWRSLVGPDPFATTTAPIADMLWQPDGSHPTVAGTYLAACVLYAAAFHASPVGLTDIEGLDPGLARTIQSAAATSAALP